MPWQNLLNRRDRLPVNPDLAEGFATLLHTLGTVTPLELAVVGGRLMSTPGLAFLVGYQAALRMLWPSAPLSLGALCATEQRSLRVADMQTRLSDLRVSGRKDFVTAGDAADWLLVAARSEASGETPRLSLAVVYPDEPGVRLEKLPAIADAGHQPRSVVSGQRPVRTTRGGWLGCLRQTVPHAGRHLCIECDDRVAVWGGAGQ